MSAETCQTLVRPEFCHAEIEAMINEPSLLALQRMGTYNPKLSARMDFQEVAPDGHMRFFLREQSLGYYDEVITALHALEPEYKGFLKKSAYEKPERIIHHPGMFAGVLNEEENEEVCRAAAANEVLMSEFFDEFAVTAPKHVAAEAANQVLTLQDNIPVVSMLAALRETNALPPLEKRGRLLDNMNRNAYFWGSLGAKAVLCPPVRKDNDYTGRNHRAMDNLKETIAAGIISVEEILANLDGRIETGLSTLGSSVYAPQVQHEAIGTRLLFDLQGFSGRSKEEAVLAAVKADLKLELKRHSRSHERIFAYLSKDDPVLSAAIQRLCTDYDELHGTDTLKAFQKELTDAQNGIEHTKSSWEARVYSADHETLQKIHDALLEIPEGEKHPRELKVYSALEISPDDTEFARSVIELAALRKEDYLLYHLDKLAKLYEGEEERLKKVVMTLWNESKDNVPTDTWDLLASIVGEEDSIVESIRRKVLNSSSLYNMAYTIRDVLEADKPALTTEECVQMLTERLSGMDEDDENWAQQIVINLCYNFFGSKLTKTMLTQLPDTSKLKNTLLDTEDAYVRTLLESPEYFDVYMGACSLRKIAHKMTPEEIERSVSGIFNKLATEHLVDTLWAIWPYMTDHHRQYVFDRFTANPALMSLESQRSYMERYFKQSIESRVLAQTPYEDPLRKVAPKAHGGMIRRLRAKTFSDEVLSERVSAMPFAPESIEGRRRNILLHYSYFYDLCDRLRDCTDVTATLPVLRGKSTEKNELAALETMVLYRELTGQTEMKLLAALTPEERSEGTCRLALERLGVYDQRATNAISYLRADGIDLIKYAMWLHTSSRSGKLQNYFGEMMGFIGDGNDINAWKFRHPKGNNLTDIPESALEIWKKDHTEAFKLASDASTITLTHALEAVYLAGVQPISNCLHYAYGSNQHGAGGLLSADAKMMIMRNSGGNVIGNAVMRIAQDDRMKPVLVLEPLYAMHPDPYWKREMVMNAITTAENYAKGMDMPLFVLSAGFQTEMRRAAKTLWSGAKFTSALLYPTTAPYSYDDSAGITEKRAFIHALKRGP